MNSKTAEPVRKKGISLLYKTMALNLIFVMLPLAITGMFSYLNYRTTIQKQSEELFKNYVDSTANNLEQLINNAGNIAISCYYNEDVLEVLFNHSEPDEEKYLTSQESEYIRHFVNTVYNDKIMDIFFITNDNYIVGCINTQVIRKMSPETRDFFNKINSTEGEITLFPLHVPDYYSNKNCEVVSIGRLIREPMTHKTLGAVIVDVSAEEIEKTIYNDVDRENINITVYDKNGTVFFGVNNGYTPQKGFASQKSGSEMIYRSFPSKLDLIIEGTLKGDIINLGMYKLLTFMIYISIFALISVWVISILFFNRLMKPLSILKNKMELITRDNLSERIEVHSNDEIGELSDIFNHMADEIQTYVKNILELTKREKEVSVLALQSQIKPHFLYNVLESVNICR